MSFVHVRAVAARYAPRRAFARVVVMLQVLYGARARQMQRCGRRRAVLLTASRGRAAARELRRAL